MAVSGPAPASSGPTGREIHGAYLRFRRHLACPGSETCDNALWQHQPSLSVVLTPDCVPLRRSGRTRCSFVLARSIPHGEHLHQCRDVFRREGDEWRMLSVLGTCFGVPLTPLP